MATSRATARALGIAIAGVAVWGAVVAYVGPTFDFDLGSTSKAWVWSESHTTLHLGPGICGLVGGLLLLVGGLRLARVGAVLGLVSGTWFLLGPTLEPLWQENGGTSGATGSSGSTTLRVLEGVGYHYGTGLVLVLLSALAIGILARSPAPAEEASPEPEPEADHAEADTIVTTEPNLAYPHNPSHA